MRILIVKLSSLGDVVHAMPAVQDIASALPTARIDWVVERAFAPLVERCAGVQRVIASDLRRWRSAPLSATTRRQWRSFRAELRAVDYDAVLDLQGLSKSALVARLALLAPGGRRYALANRTEGSSWEVPTRWVADVAVPVDVRVSAVERARRLCAAALGIAPSAAVRFGLRGHGGPSPAVAVGRPVVAFVHGTSRADKEWPFAHWVELGRRCTAAGFAVALPHGSESELQRSEAIADALGRRHVQVWPRLPLDALVDALAACAGAIGVDSGLSHIAVALGLPHVQIYNHDTAWRTGPAAGTAVTPRQLAVFAQPTPDVAAVWRAWTAAAGPCATAASAAAE